MATVNGHFDGDGGDERAASPTAHLGKRKRTDSPDTKIEIPQISKPSALQQSLENALQLIRRHDPSSSLLGYHLSPRGQEKPTVKRQRIDSADHENDTIEYRVLSGVYKSFDEIMEDVSQVRSAVHSAQPNGVPKDTDSLHEHIDVVWDILSKYHVRLKTAGVQPLRPPTSGEHVSDARNKAQIAQVLSLRTQTESGTRQLFTGLPSKSDDASILDIDGRKLPNGFELSDALTADKPARPFKDTRTFGDTFGPRRNHKPLDLPRSSRSNKGDVLHFVVPLENVQSANRFDYRHASLGTGSWLRYATTNLEKKGKERESKIAGLFKASYSSFAPSCDNSASTVTGFDRARQWWHRYSKPTMSEVADPTELVEIPPKVELVDNFEDLIENYISEEPVVESAETVEKLLEDISELIETVSSYQVIRDQEVAKGPASASKPSRPEFDMYEMLRNQLQILISSLPPFAVAKLNGDQLENLNISTRISITPTEFSGTSQIDEYTLHRTRSAQQATNTALSRHNTLPTTNRTAYSTPAAAVYNTQARAYNSNVPATAYAARTGNSMYTTPRPSVSGQNVSYTQPSYRTSTGTFSTPSVQQFQRPMQNGYSHNATPSAQPAQMQYSSQGSYPQGSQDALPLYARSQSTQGPFVNGQNTQSYQYRSYTSTGSDTPSQGYAGNMDQRTLMEKMRLNQQRHSSGTPQPQVRNTDVTPASETASNPPAVGASS